MANQTSRKKHSATKKRTSRPKKTSRPTSRGTRRTKRRRSKSALTLRHVLVILGGLVVLVAMGSWGLIQYQNRKVSQKRTCRNHRSEITAIIQGVLFRNGLSRHDVQWKTRRGFVSLTFRVDQPRIKEIYRALSKELIPAYQGLKVVKKGHARICIFCKGKMAFQLTCLPLPIVSYPSTKKKPQDKEEKEEKPPPVKRSASKEAKVAIVIDDIGYDLAIARNLMNLPAPITLSLFPYGPHSKEIAKEAAAKGYEVLMHVPMEPEGYPEKGKDPGPGALYVRMLPEDIKRQLNEDLDRIPEVCGINNHMGSRLTCNSKDMLVVMKVLKKRKKFFLDSRTSVNSVGFKIAREEGIPTVERDVFLDNVRDVKKIREQMERLVEKAKKRGYAVGIGHPHRATYLALRKAIPEYQKKGITFVFVSSLAQ